MSILAPPPSICLRLTLLNQESTLCLDRWRNWRPFLGLHGYSHRKCLHLSEHRRNGIDVGGLLDYLSAFINQPFDRSPTAGGQYHWVSEFSPRWCQKYLSYITGMSLQRSNTMLDFVDTLNRLAPRDWMARICRRAVLLGRDNHPRLDCSQSRVLRTSKMAWYPACRSGRDILHHLQHFSGEKATTRRRIHPARSRHWTFRYRGPPLGFGT